MKFANFLFICLITLNLTGKPIETFYGTIEVEEEVLLQLIESDEFQRLKEVHQYGVAYYTTHREEFTRYAHSLGVFHLLRANQRPLKEQIAGLLHDVSHTVFSHVGDWVFHKEHCDIDYQNSIHEAFLEKTTLSKILKEHGINPEEVLPTQKNAPALEQPRPNPSADRIDYSLQGAYYQNFLTKNEVLELFNDFHYLDDRWLTSKVDLTTKMIEFTLFMTEDSFGSPRNYYASRWLADAIIKALELGLITLDEFHLGTDKLVWDKLLSSNDPVILSRMDQVFHADNFFKLVAPNEGDVCLHTKFWGFDPWIIKDNKIVRLTSINDILSSEYQSVKDRISRGFSIKFTPQENASKKSL